MCEINKIANLKAANALREIIFDFQNEMFNGKIDDEMYMMLYKMLDKKARELEKKA